MPTSDPLDILLTHNHWATRQVLDACAKLSHEQFHQKFDMGLCSLHETLRHVIGAMRGWTDLLAKREFRPRPEQGEQKTVDELIAMLDEAAADLTRHARIAPMDEQLTRERGGKFYTFRRGAVLTHITTHGMHHRAQAINMLRQLGVQPLPDPSVLTWIFAADTTS